MQDKCVSNWRYLIQKDNANHVGYLIQGDNENYVKTSTSRALVVYFVLILVRLKKGVLIVGLEL